MQTRRREAPAALTPTEKLVVGDVLQGLANHEIARRRGVSVRTVQRHAARARAKLGASSPADLARLSARFTALAGGRVLYEGPGFSAGEFSLPPDDWRWGRENWVGDLPHVVFPRTAVAIERGASSVVDSSVAVLYEGDQTYRRALVDPRGDHCTFFMLADDLVSELAPRAAGRGGRMFRLPHVPVDARTYAAQLHGVRALMSRGEALEVDELVLSILRRVFAGVRAQPPMRATRAAADLVEEAKSALGASFARPQSLARVARAVHASPSHLARVFAAVTGSTLHAHVTQLRLREALYLVLDSDEPIGRIAARVGFAGHSHFSQRFRLAFGFAPAHARARRLKTRDVARLLAQT